MSYRNRNRKKSQKNRLQPTAPAMTKSKSAPDKRQTVDWPGSIDDKYVEDVRSRLDVIEANSVSDDMIRAFLAANEMKQRHAVEALKKTVEWRKGRQMFYNNYRRENERYLFLSQIRKCGKGIGSTFGHTQKGRLVFYEKLGANFSIALQKEFTCTEFRDHMIVWCENLLNCALANCGRSSHLIYEIPYYENEERKKESSAKLEEEEEDNNNNIAINDHNDDESNNNVHFEGDNNDERIFAKHKFDKVEVESRCIYSDVVGIIDWHNVKLDAFLANKDLLLTCAQLLCIHYPHLINRLYHINMPLNFEEIENELRGILPAQIFTKSIFLESTETHAKRSEFIKNKNKTSRNRRSRYNIMKSKKKNKAKEEEKEENMNVNLDGVIDEFAQTELKSVISASQLPKEYGGDLDSSSIFTFVDPIYTYLVGASCESAANQPTGYEQYDEDTQTERKSWKQHPLRSNDRHSVRLAVKRGEHYKWQYMAEYDRVLLFGLTFEADGFRGKAIKVVVREEVEHKCGYYPMFGDFIVLKNGNLIFQFRNAKGGKRLNLLFKIDKEDFPKSFINKHLPDYHAEERLLQTKTLNFGGKNQRRARSTKSPSEVSGSTAISTSPPLGSFTDNNLHNLSINRPKSTENTHTISLTKAKSSAGLHAPSSGSSSNKRSKSQRHKKSSKKIKTRKKSIKKRSKTPEPPYTPV